MPQLFKEAFIVGIYKKGSRIDCSNYRPISLLSHVYKLFVGKIATRTKADLYASFPTTQAAYCCYYHYKIIVIINIVFIITILGIIIIFINIVFMLLLRVIKMMIIEKDE